MRRRRRRRCPMGSIARTRRGSFRAIARGQSQRALDVARGLGRRRSPHLSPPRRKSPDGHRDRMVRRHASDLVHRAASRTPRRRLLRHAVFDLPAHRHRDAGMGDAPATPPPPVRRITFHACFDAGPDRRLTLRLDSHRPPAPRRTAGRARTRMHQPHDARRLAQSNDLGLDFVALRSNVDERFRGLDSSRLHDSSRLPPHRRLKSQQAESSGG